METIIGLGKAGCRITDRFATYPQYTTYKMDTNLEPSSRCYSLIEYNHPEKYEENCPNVKQFFKDVKGDVLFVTSCGFVSAATLRILEQIKDKCNISILYVKPDVDLLSDMQKLNENTIFHILQEYTRSSVFKRIYLVDNAKMAKIVGDVPVREHYDKLNELLVSAIHMINIFDNSTSEISTFAPFGETARMSTFSLVDYHENEEKMFFSLDIPREKRYYYAVPEKTLQTDSALLKKITEQLKNMKQYDKMKVSYGIFSTDYEDIYVYGLLNSSVVQNNNFRLDKELDL